MKPERTAFFIVNDDHNTISPLLPRETFVRLYEGKLRLEEGEVVKVEGTFWTESLDRIVEADCTGFYEVTKSGPSPNPDYDQVQAHLVRTERPSRGRPYVVLPESELRM